MTFRTFLTPFCSNLWEKQEDSPHRLICTKRDKTVRNGTNGTKSRENRDHSSHHSLGESGGTGTTLRLVVTLMTERTGTTIRLVMGLEREKGQHCAQRGYLAWKEGQHCAQRGTTHHGEREAYTQRGTTHHGTKEAMQEGTTHHGTREAMQEGYHPVYQGGYAGGIPTLCTPPYVHPVYTTWYIHPCTTLGIPPSCPVLPARQRRLRHCLEGEPWAQSGRKAWVGGSLSS